LGTAKKEAQEKLDPEEEQKLIDYIRGEALRGSDPPMIRQKLLQAGWSEPDVVRLIDLATSKPDFLRSSKVKVMDIEPVLVVEEDGNLKLKRDFVDGQIKKKVVDDPVPVLHVYTDISDLLSLENRIRIIRMVVQGALGALVVYNAYLLVQRFIG
jgi:hypothetical protein